MSAVPTYRPMVAGPHPAPFAYDDLDTETRIVVQQRASELKTLIRRSAADIIEIGSKLIDVKFRLGHGHFCKWLKAEFGWSEPSAWRFMQVCEHFQNHQIEGFAPSALYMLAAPSTPDEARQEALDRAAAGEHITVKTAQTLIADRKPAPVAPAAAPDSVTPGRGDRPVAPTPNLPTTNGSPLQGIPPPTFAPVAAILDGLVAWLGTVAPGDRDTQRIILYNIEASTLVGQQHLERLLSYPGIRPQGVPARRADVLTAVSRLFAAMKATHAAARQAGENAAEPADVNLSAAAQLPIEPPPHDYSYTGTELPDGVRAWLKDIFAEDEERWPALLQAIITDRNNGGHQLWENLRHSRRLYAFTPAELLAAVRTLHAELTAARPPEPAPEIEADEVEAQYAPIFALESGIRAWLAAFPVSDRLPLMEAIKAERTHHPHFLALAAATPAPRRIGDVYQAINNTVDQLRVAAEQAAARTAGLPAATPATTPAPTSDTSEESDPLEPEPYDRMVVALGRIRTHLRNLQQRIGTSVELDMALIAVDEAEELWSLLAA